MKSNGIIVKILTNPRLVKFGNIIIKWFYPKLSGFNPFDILAFYFIPQKLFRCNGSVPWAVHHSSLVYDEQNIQIGNSTSPGIMPGQYIQGKNGIIFGNNVIMGPGVGIISANHDISDFSRHIPSQPIIIGDNVWIGMNSVVLPGVKIGSNVIIGALSVVTSDIPNNSVAIGNPCKVIKNKESTLV